VQKKKKNQRALEKDSKCNILNLGSGFATSGVEFIKVGRKA
jgi:hypothetical protein